MCLFQLAINVHISVPLFFFKNFHLLTIIFDLPGLSARMLIACTTHPSDLFGGVLANASQNLIVSKYTEARRKACHTTAVDEIQYILGLVRFFPSTMFSAWTSALHDAVQDAVASAQEVATEATKDFFKLEEGAAAETPPRSESSSVERLLLAPSGIPSSQWSLVLATAFSDSNFFVIPPARILSDNAEALVALGVVDQCKNIRTVDLSEWVGLDALAANEAVARTHYAVMPRFVGDEQFLQHALWRLEVLHGCRDVGQMAALYEAITSERVILEPRRRLHGEDNSLICQQLREGLLREKESADWLVDKRRVVADCSENARGSCSLLRGFVAKGERSGLSDSIFESCKYHKAKLAGVIGDLESCASRLNGTDMDPEEGALYTDILGQNDELSSVIADYARLVLSSDALDVAPPDAPNVPNGDGTCTSPRDTVRASHEERSTEGACIAVEPDEDADQPNAPSGDEFEAKLPWDDDDDDF